MCLLYYIYNRKDPAEFNSEGRDLYYFIKNCGAVRLADRVTNAVSGSGVTCYTGILHIIYIYHGKKLKIIIYTLFLYNRNAGYFLVFFYKKIVPLKM